jgi:uncharacterized membrane protein
VDVLAHGERTRVVAPPGGDRADRAGHPPQAGSHRPAGGRAGDRVRRRDIDLLAWQAVSGLDSIGPIACLAAAACYGISYVYMDKYLARRGIGPVVLSACQLGAASVWLAVALGVTGAPVPRLDATVVVSILILGLIGTGAVYVLNYQIIASVGATVASTVTYLLPIVAIIADFLVLGEHITLPDLAGIALILAGVALVRTRATQALTTADHDGAGIPLQYPGPVFADGTRRPPRDYAPVWSERMFGMTRVSMWYAVGKMRLLLIASLQTLAAPAR